MKWLFTIVMLLAATPVFAEDVCIRQINGKPDIYFCNPNEAGVTITLPSTSEATNVVKDGDEVTITLPPPAATPTSQPIVLPGQTKVEADVWAGSSESDNANGFYIGGRVSNKFYQKEFGNGVKLKTGPYLGINYWEGEKDYWSGNNTRYSLGVSTNLSRNNWSVTAHIGVGYQESEGEDKGGRYGSSQYDAGPEAYGELNTKNDNTSWLKRRTIYGQIYAPTNTTQHNSWDDKQGVDKPYDNQRWVVGLYQDVYTTSETANGYRGSFGLTGSRGYAFGNRDVFYSFGPYLRGMKDGKDVVRINFMNPEFHSEGDARTMRIVDVSISLGGIKALAN